MLQYLVFMSLQPSDQDILKEIGNIGAGNASKALSDMTDQKIEVGFPTVKLEELDKIPEIIEKETEEMIAVWLDVNLDGENRGMGRLLLLMNSKSALKLSDKLTSREIEELDSMGKSSLKETGNILSGSALTAITNFMDMRLIEGIPKLEEEPLEDIMSDVVFEISSEDEEALIFRTKFSVDEDISAYFLFVFRDGGKKLMLESLQN